MANSNGSGNAPRNLYDDLFTNFKGSSNQLIEHAARHPAETAEMWGKLWTAYTNALTRAQTPQKDARRFNEVGWDAPYFQALQSNWMQLEETANDWLDKTADDDGIDHQRRKY